jgi:hypothetical protein
MLRTGWPLAAKRVPEIAGLGIVVLCFFAGGDALAKTLLRTARACGGRPRPRRSDIEHRTAVFGLSRVYRSSGCLSASMSSRAARRRSFPSASVRFGVDRETP